MSALNAAKVLFDYHDVKLAKTKVKRAHFYSRTRPVFAYLPNYENNLFRVLTFAFDMAMIVAKKRRVIMETTDVSRKRSQVQILYCPPLL